MCKILFTSFFLLHLMSNKFNVYMSYSHKSRYDKNKKVRNLGMNLQKYKSCNITNTKSRNTFENYQLTTSIQIFYVRTNDILTMS